MIRLFIVSCLVFLSGNLNAFVLQGNEPDLGGIALADDLGDLHAEINKFRRKRLLPELTINQGLLCAAALHASDIGPKRRCSNIGSDGSNLGQRLKQCSAQVGGETELVACGHGEAYQAVIGLLAEPSTSAILLNPRMTQFGADQVNRFWVVVLSP